MAKANEMSASTNSSLYIFKGVASIIFGLLALVWPAQTLVTLAILLTLWLIVIGVMNIFRGVMTIGHSSWVVHILLGALQLGVGAYLVQRPGLTIATFVALVSIVLIVQGVIDLFIGLIVNNLPSSYRVLNAVAGVFGILAGIIIWRYPVHGTLAFVWVLGLYALITGPLWLAVGLESRNQK